MQNKNDSILDRQTYEAVCEEADRMLRESDTLGVFPTSVKQVLLTANVEEVYGPILDASFLDTMREKARGVLKSAVDKVLGLLDSVARLIFVDRTILKVRQDFIRLHEAGHAYMPWQDQTYTIIEECKKTVSPDIADQFDVEANVFASEVLFQRDAFINEASDYEFGISVPKELSNKYGASIYASIRQYVSKNYHCCIVLVLNNPEPITGEGFRSSVRRIISSTKFDQSFNSVKWPSYFTPNDILGKFIPVSKRRMSGPFNYSLIDDNGDNHEFIGEVFTNTYQIFILLHHNKSLTTSRIIL